MSLHGDFPRNESCLRSRIQANRLLCPCSTFVSWLFPKGSNRRRRQLISTPLVSRHFRLRLPVAHRSPCFRLGNNLMKTLREPCPPASELRFHRSFRNAQLACCSSNGKVSLAMALQSSLLRWRQTAGKANSNLDQLELLKRLLGCRRWIDECL